MKYYLLFFSGIYTLAIIGFGVLSLFINIGSASTVPTLIVAGFFTAWQFVKREQRIPDAKEKSQLIWGSIGCTFIISAILVALALLLVPSLKGMFTLNLPFWLWSIIIGVFAFLILIEFAVFYFSYGWYAKLCLKNLDNKKHLR